MFSFQPVSAMAGHPDVGSMSIFIRRLEGVGSAWIVRVRAMVSTVNAVCPTISSPTLRMKEEEFPVKLATVTQQVWINQYLPETSLFHLTF